MLEEPATQLLIVVSFMLLVGTFLVSLLVIRWRHFVLWLANWAWSLATWAFPKYHVPVPPWALPPDSFERMVIDGLREVHGARVRTTLKDGWHCAARRAETSGDRGRCLA